MKSLQYIKGSSVQFSSVAQSCPTLCDPMHGSPPGSPVPGILQARTLEWAAISFSSAWKWKVKVKSFNHVRPSATPWTAAYQASPSMGFSRQEYWSGVPLQYSCLENPMDRGAWKAAVHGVAEGRTWLNDFTFTFHFHALEKEMATHSSVLTWKIPGTGEPGGLPSMGSHRVRHDWSDLAAAAAETNITL